MTTNRRVCKKTSIDARKHATLLVKKLKDTAAFTLAEVLATVIVIGLVSGGLATAVTVGARQFGLSVAQSESQMLYSSIKQDLENDLTYIRVSTEAKNSEVILDENKNVLGYASLHHADKDELLYLKALDNKGNAVEAGEGDVTGEGQLALCSDDGKVKNRLLGKAAYNNGLKACVKKLQYDEGAKNYIANVVITSSTDSSEVLAGGQDFTIKALNNVDAKTTTSQ